MIADAERVSQDDIEELARLHRITMPHSVLAHMGPSTLERYYRWVVQSKSEQMFLSREGTKIVGAAVLSVGPNSVMRRFVAVWPVSFVAHAAAAFLRSRDFRADMRGFLLEQRHAPATQIPEVMQIFVAPERQSRLTGTALLERVEAWLKAERLSRYRVRTLLEHNDATLAFYTNRGFQPAGQSRFCGGFYRVLEKALA